MKNKEQLNIEAICDDESKEVIGESRSLKKEKYKEKECKVIHYNKNEKILDIRFDRYGIRLRNIDNIENNNVVLIRYKGEIGNPDFSIECRN